MIFHDPESVAVLERCNIKQAELVEDGTGAVFPRAKVDPATVDLWGVFLRLEWPDGETLDIETDTERQAALDLLSVAHRFGVDADGVWTMLVWGVGA